MASAPAANDRVVIFKAAIDSEKCQSDAYRETLASNGFDVMNVPVLDFEFFNLDRLLAKLKNPQDYSGLIFSSLRSVAGCKCAVEKEENGISILAKWSCLFNFAVGEATANAAAENGISTRGKEAGNANSLADIIAMSEFEKPFLYPIGSLTNNTFKLKLKERNIELDDIVIYKTKQHPDLKKSMESLLSKICYPVHFLYFSPSGVNFTLPIMREMNYDLERIKFVAIGPTTEKALKENGLRVHRTVALPTPSSALEALKS